MAKKIFRKTHKILVGAIFVVAMFFVAQNIFAQNPPFISNGSPMGVLANTNQVTLSVNTDQNATCRYSTSPGLDYDLMSDTFSNTGQTYHSQQLIPASGRNYGNFTGYTYYVRCDTAGNKSINDYAIVFSIDQSSASSGAGAPARFNGRPTGALPADTREAILSFNTDKNATCRYSTNPGTDYYSMANNFSITGQTSHYQNLGGLLDGRTYAFYVRCIDSAGNWNTDDFPILFSTAQPSVDSDITPPNRSNGQPAGTLSAGTNTATLFVATDENAHCEYSATPGVNYALMVNNFSVTNQTTHSKALAGLAGGQTYNYYVRCADAFGNANPSDYTISFSVASGGSAVPSGTPLQTSTGEPQVLGVSTYNFGLDLTLVKTQANSDVYAISEQTKRKIVSRNAFDSYAEYWQALKINTVLQAYLNSIPDTTLIKTPDSFNVYILDKGFKRLLVSAGIFNSYGFDWNKIVTINQAELDSYVSAPLIKHGVDLYWLDKNKVTHYFPSTMSLARNGYNVRDAVEINDFEFESYTKGIPMTP